MIIGERRMCACVFCLMRFVRWLCCACLLVLWMAPFAREAARCAAACRACLRSAAVLEQRRDPLPRRCPLSHSIVVAPPAPRPTVPSAGRSAAHSADGQSTLTAWNGHGQLRSARAPPSDALFTDRTGRTDNEATSKRRAAQRTAHTAARSLSLSLSAHRTHCLPCAQIPLHAVPPRSMASTCPPAEGIELGPVPPATSVDGGNVRQATGAQVQRQEGDALLSAHKQTNETTAVAAAPAPSSSPAPGASLSTEYLEYLHALRQSWSDCPSLSIAFQDLSFEIRNAATIEDAKQAAQREKRGKAVGVPSKREENIPNLAKTVCAMALSPLRLGQATVRAAQGAKPDQAEVLRALAPASGCIKPGTMTLVLAPPGQHAHTGRHAFECKLARHKLAYEHRSHSVLSVCLLQVLASPPCFAHWLAVSTATLASRVKCTSTV